VSRQGAGATGIHGGGAGTARKQGMGWAGKPWRQKVCARVGRGGRTTHPGSIEDTRTCQGTAENSHADRPPHVTACGDVRRRARRFTHFLWIFL
jgi:hypothetical protein